MKPVQSGMALALTISVSYSLCTAIAVLFPQIFGGFVNALFHGVDLGKPAAGTNYGWPEFIYAIVVLAAWGFAVGAFFAWVYRGLSRTEA